MLGRFLSFCCCDHASPNSHIGRSWYVSTAGSELLDKKPPELPSLASRQTLDISRLPTTTNFREHLVTK